MDKTFKTTLLDHCQLDLSKRVLVGVSGGPDSVCLLHLLLKLGVPLVVAHFDHRLRADSGKDALFVRDLAQSWDVPFCLGSEDVQTGAEQQALSLEEAARIYRYRFLFEQAQQWNTEAVAVAHTADDQVETVLMHLLRGSGTTGLRGMAYRSLPSAWSEQIPLIRPLLGIWRDQVMDYLMQNHLLANLDPSNKDNRFYRNYLRNELIPALESRHPLLRERIWHTADIIREDYQVLEKSFLDKWNEVLLSKGEGYLVLDYELFSSLAIGIQRGLVRKGINLLRPGLRDIDFLTVQAVLEFVHTPTRTGHRDLAAGLYCFLENGSLWLASWEAVLPSESGRGECWAQIEAGVEYHLSVPGTIQLSNDWALSAELRNDANNFYANALSNSDPYTAWLDLQSLQDPLLIRRRKAGDRFQPLGMGGSSLKLSDFMVNVKLPARARHAWPLVLSAESIAWVPGFRLAHPFRITPSTETALKLVLKRSHSSGSVTRI
jgi:tRNA(Ile)-lysidine synthase